MLQIVIPKSETFNEATQEFVYVKEQVIQLEHSLISISKWEAKWHKAFLGKQQKTTEETIDYVRCMTITQNVPPEAYLCLSNDNLKVINEYIDDSMTATWFSDDKNHSKGGSTGETVTSELIYYWMIALQIPFECQRWHLNRLLTLIRICNIKNAPQKKMGKRDLMQRNSSLNAARRAKMHSRG